MLDRFGAGTVAEALDRAARTDRGMVVLGRGGERRVPYAELAALARRAAHELTRRGVRAGDRVCLLSTTDLPLLTTLFGTWYAGAVPVLLPMPRRRRDLERYLADMADRVARVDARLLCVADDLAGAFGAAGVGVLPIGAVLAGSGTLAGPAPADPDSLALLQFTSGTTGPSRAVLVRHGQVLTNMATMWEAYGIGPDAVGMIWVPLYHDMGVIGMCGAVAAGIELVMQAPEHFLAAPMSWPVAMSRHRVQLTAAPNFAYALAGRLLSRAGDRLDLSALRWAINGAEPIDPDALAGFVAAGSRFGMRPTVPCPMYGLAEATLAVTLRPSDRPVAVQHVDGDALSRHHRAVPVPAGSPGARRLVACGHPLAGTRLRITGPDGAELPAGEVGEVQVAGPCVTTGYWREPAASADLRDGDWLRTGDLGYLGADGLVICGRHKDMIILNGRNLYPEEFETEAERVHGVRAGNTIAFALPGTERMVLVAESGVGAERAAGLAAAVLDHLRRVLPTAPAEVVICPPSAIPKTSSGKRQRSRCRDLYLAGQLPALASATPGGDAVRPAVPAGNAR